MAFFLVRRRNVRLWRDRRARALVCMLCVCACVYLLHMCLRPLTGFHENSVNIIQSEVELLDRFSRKFVVKLILSEVELFYNFLYKN